MVQNINLVKQIRFLFITFLIIIFSSSNSYTNEICDSFVIDNLNHKKALELYKTLLGNKTTLGSLASER